MKTYVCAHCGTDQVYLDASAVYDPVRDVWVLGAVFDQAFCERCDKETTLIERELTVQ